ncbi:phosphatidate cytidylyltransferase [Arcobacter sp. F2176]|jgi:phosphatidate cytidylyltransferase|uniref:phosphatidate cytidylyltransferase n=1 Tax=Arcobacter sp. F2176 TaxID=2044511 RepID=UPI00100B94BF|nr:phosphatidate cytidylyltransferase [Arcobacter sp. F2176]RXJ80888.1 phosphatidate cytidylyltransferase [Arcobacter sp. F2176]|tara:strand:+ start:440 stop:1198 length:759 start_codon:yes stop_codon:yes gene_type:complete
MYELISSSSTRIKTALVLFAVFILVSYINTMFVTWLFLGAFMIVGIDEAMNLFKVKDSTVFQYAAITWIIAYFYPYPEILVLIALVIFASNLAYKRDMDKKVFLPFLYPLISFLTLLTLYNEYGIGVLWWMLFVVASADVGAYYVGRAFGKTKFCETSPNKTLEGVAGGIILAAILGPIFAIDGITYMGTLVISIVVAISSIFGDLFESYLKREAEVKDSGSILPGHGGVLDRTDGFLFASVVMLVLLRAIL